MELKFQTAWLRIRARCSWANAVVRLKKCRLQEKYPGARQCSVVVGDGWFIQGDKHKRAGPEFADQGFTFAFRLQSVIASLLEYKKVFSPHFM